jgi:hypothetical protein
LSATATVATLTTHPSPQHSPKGSIITTFHRDGNVVLHVYEANRASATPAASPRLDTATTASITTWTNKEYTALSSVIIEGAVACKVSKATTNGHTRKYRHREDSFQHIKLTPVGQLDICVPLLKLPQQPPVGTPIALHRQRRPNRPLIIRAKDAWSLNKRGLDVVQHYAVNFLSM